jgi:hydrogenase maturation protease
MPGRSNKDPSVSAASAAGGVDGAPAGAEPCEHPWGNRRQDPRRGRRHTPASTVIIGVGNSFRSDDGAGLAAARALRASVPEDVTVVELDGEATSLMEAWTGCDLAIVIDAVKGDKPAGHVYRFDARVDHPPRDLFRFSTHAFGVSGAIELGRALGRLPNRLLVYGIEGDNFEAGTGLTPDVERALAEAKARILREVEK